MRYINNRNKEPKELVEYRKTSGVVYDDLGKERKDVIRDCLIDEQGYICAYCMGRISNDTCTIEHYISQTRHETSPFSEEEHKRQSLLYSNMSGVCINDSEHCDKKRGNVPLKILDPHNPLCEEFVTYSFSGRILPAGREEDKVKEDIQTLGLDCDKYPVNSYVLCKYYHGDINLESIISENEVPGDIKKCIVSSHQEPNYSNIEFSADREYVTIDGVQYKKNQ